MKPNVLQLVNSFHQGGSERQAVQLARLLHESGRYNVSIASQIGEGVLRTEAERIGLGEITSYPLTSFYDRNALTQLRRFAAFLRERQIDVVHTHDFYTNIFGLSAAALARVPVRIGSRRESAVRVAKQRAVERASYRLAHAVVANCEEVRQQLINVEGLAPGKTVTVYNGLNMERLTPRLRRDEALQLFNLPPARRFVTIVANLREDLKDHPTFLRAAQHVRSAVPDSAFVLAGEGELTEPMRALAAQLGLRDDAFFIGRCENVAELLHVSDLCVLSSKAEGFSNSVIEYMAAGRPAVVTAVGGAREAVSDGETGYVVGVGDHEKMAARIIELLRDPERASQMGRRGREVATEKFSCEAQLGRTEELYGRLLAKVRSGAAPPLAVGRERSESEEGDGCEESSRER